MLGKLIIIGIIIVAAVILVPSAIKVFSPSSINALEDKIDKVTSDHASNTTTSALNKVIGGGEKLVNTLNSSLSQQSSTTQPSSLYELSPQYVTKQNYTGQVFAKNGNTCDISVPDMAQMINGQQELTHIIELNQCTMNPGEPVQVTTITANPNAPVVNPSSGIQVTPYSSNTDSNLPTLPPYYNVVQLSAQNQGNNVVINYQDSTGNTKSVTVTMKNNDKVLFSGTFYSSKFSTDVKDIPNTPHIIEMTVDNSVYGTLHASVYAPSNIQNSTISGIFTR
ncbi:MAG: hypothetical protein ABI340_03245 [Nitrososphaera sp.]